MLVELWANAGSEKVKIVSPKVNTITTSVEMIDLVKTSTQIVICTFAR